MTHEPWAEAAAAYALGVLDDEERQAFEAHLPACSICRTEVDSHLAVVGLLANAAPPVRPPNNAALRQRILQRAGGIRPIASAHPVRPPRPRVPLTGLALAASLAVATFSVVAWQRERSRASQARQELAAAMADLASRDSTLAAFIGPEVHVVSLSRPGEKPAVRVFWNHTSNLFIVTAFGLPPAPAGSTWQLWAITAGRAPVSMGTFDVETANRTAAVLVVAGEITAAGFIDSCGLTLEPAGGSPQPTELPRFRGDWRHVD